MLDKSHDDVKGAFVFFNSIDLYSCLHENIRENKKKLFEMNRCRITNHQEMYNMIECVGVGVGLCVGVWGCVSAGSPDAKISSYAHTKPTYPACVCIYMYTYIYYIIYRFFRGGGGIQNSISPYYSLSEAEADAEPEE